MSSPVHTVADVWQREIVDAGRESAVFVLAAFLVTFGVTRAITHAIRSQRVRFLRDMSVGDTHLHHLVPGILLLLLAGLLGIAVDAPLPVWVVPVMFGVGAALTLDEFALWVNLKDVYWSSEGRRSIDAVVIAAGLFGLSIIGYPFWLGVWRDVVQVSGVGIASFHLAGIIVAGVCFAKGKLYGGVVGLFFPPVGLVGAVRLATPGSPWARRFYDQEKIAKSVARFGAARPASAVAREVRDAVERPRRHWRWLVRVGIVVVVGVLVVVDSVVRAPTASNLAILALILIAVLLDAGTLRRRTAFERPREAGRTKVVAGAREEPAEVPSRAPEAP